MSRLALTSLLPVALHSDTMANGRGHSLVSIKISVQSVTVSQSVSQSSLAQRETPRSIAALEDI